MPAHIEWIDTSKYKRIGDLRFGKIFFQYGDQYDGTGSVKDLGDNVCQIGPLASKELFDEMTRDDILDECVRNGFHTAVIQRINKSRVLIDWVYDLTKTPYKRKRTKITFDAFKDKEV